MLIHVSINVPEPLAERETQEGQYKKAHSKKNKEINKFYSFRLPSSSGPVWAKHRVSAAFPGPIPFDASEWKNIPKFHSNGRAHWPRQSSIMSGNKFSAPKILHCLATIRSLSLHRPRFGPESNKLQRTRTDIRENPEPGGKRQRGDGATRPHSSWKCQPLFCSWQPAFHNVAHKNIKALDETFNHPFPAPASFFGAVEVVEALDLTWGKSMRAFFFVRVNPFVRGTQIVSHIERSLDWSDILRVWLQSQASKLNRLEVDSFSLGWKKGERICFFLCSSQQCVVLWVCYTFDRFDRGKVFVIFCCWKKKLFQLCVATVLINEMNDDSMSAPTRICCFAKKNYQNV